MQDHRASLNRLKHDQRGESNIVGLLWSVFVLAMLVGFAALVALAQPAKVAVNAAARNCARNAVESLSAGRGLGQAAQTAVYSLQNQNLEAENANPDDTRDDRADRGPARGPRLDRTVAGPACECGSEAALIRISDRHRPRCVQSRDKNR